MPDNKSEGSPEQKGGKEQIVEHIHVDRRTQPGHPNRAPEPVAGKDSLRWLYISAAVILLDQATKIFVINVLELYQRVNVLPVFDFVRLHNTGAAFSLFADAGGWQRWFFTILALVVSGVIVWWQWNLPRTKHTVLSLGLALVLAGALGNVIDRIMYGYVVDFLLFYIGDWSWPAFNVADIAITCGVTLILVDNIVLESRRGGRRATD